MTFQDEDCLALWEISRTIAEFPQEFILGSHRGVRDSYSSFLEISDNKTCLRSELSSEYCISSWLSLCPAEMEYCAQWIELADWLAI